MRVASPGQGYRGIGAAGVAGAAVVAFFVLPVSIDGQQPATTTHQSALPQITTGGQANWALHNLDLRGSRYADIDEINTSNAGRLELAWTFEAGAANSITQVTPLVVDGVMYVNSGSTLFAVNATTGEEIWTTTLGDSLEALTDRDPYCFIDKEVPAP